KKASNRVVEDPSTTREVDVSMGIRSQKMCFKNHECKNVLFQLPLQVLSPMKERALKPEMVRDRAQWRECIHGTRPTHASRKKWVMMMNHIIQMNLII